MSAFPFPCLVFPSLVLPATSRPLLANGSARLRPTHPRHLLDRKFPPALLSAERARRALRLRLHVGVALRRGGDHAVRVVCVCVVGDELVAEGLRRGLLPTKVVSSWRIDGVAYKRDAGSSRRDRISLPVSLHCSHCPPPRPSARNAARVDRTRHSPRGASSGQSKGTQRWGKWCFKRVVSSRSTR